VGTAGGARADVVAPPSGELFSETNSNSVAILLSYGTARLLLACDAEYGWSTWRTAGTRGLERSSGFKSTKQPELCFRALLTEGDAQRLELSRS
jgi:hypothetical protein